MGSKEQVAAMPVFKSSPKQNELAPSELEIVWLCTDPFLGRTTKLAQQPHLSAWDIQPVIDALLVQGI